MVSLVSPAASIPRTCSTASRLPRMIGLPERMAGSTALEKSSFVHERLSDRSLLILLSLKYVDDTISSSPRKRGPILTLSMDSRLRGNDQVGVTSSPIYS